MSPAGMLPHGTRYCDAFCHHECHWIDGDADVVGSSAVRSDVVHGVGITLANSTRRASMGWWTLDFHESCLCCAQKLAVALASLSLQYDTSF